MAISNAERQRAYRQRAAAALRAQTSIPVDTGLPDKTPPLQQAWDRASEEERQTLLRNAGITPATKPEPHRPTLLEAIKCHFDKPGAREQYLKAQRINKKSWPVWDKTAIVLELITAVLEKLRGADQDDDIIDALGGRECLQPFINLVDEA